MDTTLSTKTTAGLVWVIQAVSGLVLIGLLGLHMIANHFVVPGGLQTFQDVVTYLSNPLILALELIFLVLVTIHSLLGTRAIIFDLDIGEAQQNKVNLTLSVVGVLVIAYGFWLTFTVIN